METIIWNQCGEEQRQAVLQRPVSASEEQLKSSVSAIVSNVRDNGDVALREYTKKFDKVELEKLVVTQDEMSLAVNKVRATAAYAMRLAYENIEKFHQAQVPEDKVVETRPGVTCQRVTRPIARVGLYIPGGSAPLVSTVLMLGVPAKIAQCKTKVICTPPNRDGSVDANILFAAHLCGIDTIYKVGGAQAIAAMAYGTSTVSKVDKIYGPGNAFVTCAKQLVANDANGAGIDMPAGPSEVMVLADENANPAFVAADLLSQAEHGEDSQVILVCESLEFSQRVKAAVIEQTEQLTRRDIISKSLQHAKFIITDKNQMSAIANRYAPEHLIIQTEKPSSLVAEINQAGSVFLGPYTPESVGDYASGTNHVLPTYGFARYCSGLSVADFMRVMSVQQCTKTGLNEIANACMTLADIEGLDAHKNAVKIRLEDS